MTGFVGIGLSRVIANGAGIQDVIERWHYMMSGSSHDGLFELLAEDCIFWSPVVHTPQRGRDITYLYLSAASQVFSDDFCYVSETVDGSRAVLEFTCAIDDIQINGVDIIQVKRPADQRIQGYGATIESR